MRTMKTRSMNPPLTHSEEVAVSALARPVAQWAVVQGKSLLRYTDGHPCRDLFAYNCGASSSALRGFFRDRSRTWKYRAGLIIREEIARAKANALWIFNRATR